MKSSLSLFFPDIRQSYFQNRASESRHFLPVTFLARIFVLREPEHECIKLLSLILCGIKSNPAWMFYQKNSYRLLACKYESWYQVVQKCQILVEMGLFNLNKLCSICVLLIWCSNCFFIEVTKQACLWHYRVCLLLCLLTVQILWLQICSGKIFF